MTKTKIRVAIAGLIFSVGISAIAAEPDAKRGRVLYESRCIACHSLDANRVGPRHRGLFGRKAGAVDDYPYSSALAASAIIWNDDSLERWLADPERLISGQRMNFRISESQDRTDIIAYLKSETGVSAQ